MKREGFRHTKVFRLARLLNLPHYAAVGLLDCLWELAFRQAPQGDIGKLDDDDIAIGVGWTETDGHVLIKALVSARLLDVVDSPSRLIVHDWSEHAEDGVHSRLARAGLLFADGKAPKTSKLSSQDRPAADARIAEAIEQQKAAERHRKPRRAADGCNAVPLPLPLPLPCLLSQKETITTQSISLVPADADPQEVLDVPVVLFQPDSAPVVLAALMIRVFNAVWETRKMPTPGLVAAVARRRKEHWPAWRIVAMPIVTWARCQDAAFRKTIQPSWLMRDGKHARTDAAGRTNGGVDWLEREYERIDALVIDKRLESIARQAQVLEDLLRVGVGVRTDSGL